MINVQSHLRYNDIQNIAMVMYTNEKYAKMSYNTVHVTIFPYLFFGLLNGFLATSQAVFVFEGKSCTQK